MSNHDEFPITFVLRFTGCVRVSLFPLNLPQHISTLVKFTLKCIKSRKTDIVFSYKIYSSDLCSDSIFIYLFTIQDARVLEYL